MIWLVVVLALGGVAVLVLPLIWWSLYAKDWRRCGRCEQRLGMYEVAICEDCEKELTGPRL